MASSIRSKVRSRHFNGDIMGDESLADGHQQFWATNSKVTKRSAVEVHWTEPDCTGMVFIGPNREKTVPTLVLHKPVTSTANCFEIRDATGIVIGGIDCDGKAFGSLDIQVTQFIPDRFVEGDMPIIVITDDDTWRHDG